MSKMKKLSEQQSIYDYLDLLHRAWYVEFEINDFGASLSSLLELPLKIYEMDKKTFFWSFLKQFLQKCEISFILRKNDSTVNIPDSIELALIGFWEKQQLAIPLWILSNKLLGFEIIKFEKFTILDSEPLFWNSIPLQTLKCNISQIIRERIVFFVEGMFQNNKIVLKIFNTGISISEDYNELEFFERIAETIIPELDESEED